MADDTTLRHRAGKSEALPRIYYYRTRHYRPNVAQRQQVAERSDGRRTNEEPVQPAAFSVVPPGNDVNKRQVHEEPPRQALASVKQKAGKIPLRVLTIALLLMLGTYMVYVWRTSVADSEEAPPEMPFFSQQRMKELAATEVNTLLTQPDQTLTDWSELEEYSSRLGILGKTSNPLFDLKRELEQKTLEINNRLKQQEATHRETEAKLLALMKQEIAQLTDHLNGIFDEASKGVDPVMKPGPSEQVEASAKQLSGLQQRSQDLADNNANIRKALEQLPQAIESLKDAPAMSDVLGLLNMLAKLGMSDNTERKLVENVRSSVIEHLSSKAIKDQAVRIWQDKHKTQQEKVNELAAAMAELIDTINLLRSDDPHSPHTDIDSLRPTIDKWIEEAILKAKPDILQSIQSSQSTPTEKQLEIIREWIQGYLQAEVPRLVKTASKRLDSAAINVGDLTKDTAKLEQTLQMRGQDKLILDKRSIELIMQELKSEKIIEGLTEAEVRRIVEREIEAFAADRINMTDYALASSGGSIVMHKTSANYRAGFMDWLSGSRSNSPTIILMPGNVVGQCWAFAGDHGYVTIRLPYPIRPSSFSLDHVSRGVAVSTSSAPKNFRVWGLKSPSDEEPIILGDYIYAISGKPVQTFNVQPDDIRANDTLEFQYVLLEVYSNYGNEDYTCVYRFRVHGEPVVPLENTSQDNAGQEDNEAMQKAWV